MKPIRLLAIGLVAMTISAAHAQAQTSLWGRKASFSVGGVLAVSTLDSSYKLSVPYPEEPMTLTDDLAAKSVAGFSLGIGYYVSRRLEIFGAGFSMKTGRHPGLSSLSVPNQNVSGDFAMGTYAQDRRSSRLDLLFGLRFHLAPGSKINAYLGLGGCLTSSSMQLMSDFAATDAYDNSGSHEVVFSQVDLKNVRVRALGGFVTGGAEFALGRRLSLFAEGTYKSAKKSVEDPVSALVWSPEKARVNLGGFVGSVGLRWHLLESTGSAGPSSGQYAEVKSWAPGRRASFSLGAVYATSSLASSYMTPDAGITNERLTDALPGRTTRGLSFGAGLFLSRRLELFLAAQDTKTGRYWGTVSVSSGVPDLPDGYSIDTSGQDRNASRFQLLFGLRVHLAPRGRLDPYLGFGGCASSASMALASSVPYNIGWTGYYDDSGHYVEKPEYTIVGVEVEKVKAHALGGFLIGGIEFGLSSRLRLFAEGLYTFAEEKSIEHPLSRAVDSGPFTTARLSLGGFTTSVGLRFAAPDRSSPNPYRTEARKSSFSFGLLYVMPMLGYSWSYSEPVYFDTGTLSDTVPAKTSIPGVNLGLGFFVSRKVELFAAAHIVISGNYRGKVSLTLPGNYRDNDTAASQQDRSASQSDLLFGAKIHFAAASEVDPYVGFGGCYASASLQFMSHVTIEDDYGPFGDYHINITNVDLQDITRHAIGGFFLGGCEVAVGRGVAAFAEGLYKLAGASAGISDIPVWPRLNLGGFVASLGLRISL